MRYCARALSATCVTLLLWGCSGGGSETALGPSLPVVNSTDGSGSVLSVALGPQPATATLPVVAGIVGTIAFPAVNTATSVDVSAAATPPPSATLQSVRHKLSDFSLDIYEYITLAPKKTVTLPALPALHFTFPASVTVAGKSVFFGITDPIAQAGALTAFATEGPAKVSGQSATVRSILRPLVLQAGHRYTFIVYALAIASTVTKPTIYVANTGAFNSSTGYSDPSVTTYHASGTPNLPAITSGLNLPQYVAVGPTGTIYVLDADYYVATYGRDGVRQPLTLTLPTPSHDESASEYGINVEPDGTIDVATSGICTLGACGFGSVLRYAPDGTSRGAIDMTPSSGVRAMALDAAGNIYVIGNPGTAIMRYAPDGSAHTQVLSGLTRATALAIDATARLYVVEDQMITTYNADGSRRALSISPDFVPGAIAVDAAGKIYVVDSADGQIVTYNVDGSAAAPTLTTGTKPAGIAVQ